MLLKPLNDFAGNVGFMSDAIQIWGRYKGYQFTLGCYGENTTITIFSAITFTDPGSYSILDTFLTELEKDKKINTHKSNRGSITITKSTYLKSVTAEDLQMLLDEIVAKYQDLSATTSCFNCTQAGDKSFARYNGVAIPVCDQCYASIHGKINKDLEDHNSNQNNYLSGTIGAVLGALLGSVIWVVVGLLGYVAAIAGFAISFASAKGYSLFKGKITRLTPWLIGICSIVGMIIAQFVTLDLQFYRELNAAGQTVTLWEAMSITFQLPFIDPEITSGFVKDILIGLVFVVLGAFGTFKKLAGMASRPAGSIERV